MYKAFSILVLTLASLTHAFAVERVDNVLSQMVPDNAVTIIGMRMEQLKATPFFQKLVAQQKLPQLDEFAAETGFDPRRDVRDLLLVYNGQRAVLLARGSFHIKKYSDKLKTSNYHGFVVRSGDAPPGQAPAGFCILDSTLAAAGPMPVLQAALDQYKSGKRDNAAALLARARAIPENFQFWAVTNGGAAFLADNMPRGNANGPDFGRILRSLENTTFEADLSKGLNALAEGMCPTPADAKNLGDAARGLVGLGRLQTPEDKPDLLRFWDGIKVEQTERKVALKADISQDLVDYLLKLMQSGPRNPHGPRPAPAAAK